jgi:hypothetical protein
VAVELAVVFVELAVVTVEFAVVFVELAVVAVELAVVAVEPAVVFVAVKVAVIATGDFVQRSVEQFAVVFVLHSFAVDFVKYSVLSNFDSLFDCFEFFVYFHLDLAQANGQLQQQQSILQGNGQVQQTVNQQNAIQGQNQNNC